MSVIHMIAAMTRLARRRKREAQAAEGRAKAARKTTRQSRGSGRGTDAAR